MRGIIQWIEPTGADTFVHILVGYHKIIVREKANMPWNIRQQVTVQVSADKLHRFTN